MEQNKVRTYLLYAVGEIALVMIGILLALQVNNWNQDRYQRNEEINYLRNLKSDLQKDIELLNANMEFTIDDIESTAWLTSHSQKGNLDSIYLFIENVVVTMSSMDFTPNQNTFEEMRSSGKLSIISNETIKKQLLALNEHYISIEYTEAHVKREYEVYLWDEFCK